MIRVFDRFLFREYTFSLEDLGAYRIIFASFALLTTPAKSMRLADMPDAFFRAPLGPFAFFDGFPPTWVLMTANICLVVFLTMLLIGWRTPFASIATAVTLTFNNGWVYSIGKIDHDILFIATPFVLAFSGWGRRFSIDARRNDAIQDETGNPAAAMLAMVIGLTMFTAGWAKLVTGWLGTDVQAVEEKLLHITYVTGRKTWLGDIMLAYCPSALWEVQDWLTIILECAIPLAALRLRWYRISIALLCIFHLGVLLTFDIRFIPNIIAYAFVVPWFTIVRYFQNKKNMRDSNNFASWLQNVHPLLIFVIVSLVPIFVMLYAHSAVLHMIPLPFQDIVIVTAGIVGLVYLVNIHRLLFSRSIDVSD